MKFQTMSKQDVFQDQSQLAHALKDLLTKDMPVLIAFQVKLLIQETENNVSHHHLALVPTKFKLLLIELPVVDALLATSQDKFQMLPEPDVSTDHLLFADVLRDNQLMDTLARLAQLDKLHNQVMPRLATLHLVPLPIKSDQLLMPSTVEDVRLAKHQTSSQMPLELNALLDHLLTAQLAQPDNLMMDTHAKPAQLDLFKIQTMPDNATDQLALDNTTSNFQLTTTPVEDAKPVNGQDKFQIQPELLVLLDHLLNAQTASPEDLLMDMLVNNAQPVKFKILTTSQDVLQDHALVNTKFNLHTTHNHVEDVRPALGQDKCQINSNKHVSTDQLPNAVALRNNQPTDTAVSHVQKDSSKIPQTNRDVLDHHAMANIKSNFLLTLSHAEDVTLANGQHSCQMHQELNACQDHLLTAELALRDNLMMDTHALHAQEDKFKIQTTLDNATNHNASVSMISNLLSTTTLVEDAKPVNGQDKFQIKLRLLVLPDHLLNAQTASLEDLLMVMLVNNAQLVWFKIQTTCLNV
jgi:hypothetical protein